MPALWHSVPPQPLFEDVAVVRASLAVALGQTIDLIPVATVDDCGEPGKRTCLYAIPVTEFSSQKPVDIAGRWRDMWRLEA